MMAKTDLPMQGGCRCGRVRIEVSAPPLVTMACHCRGCQKMSASACSLSVAVPVAGFRVVEGDPVIGGLKGAAHHHFCPDCLTWMFSRPEGLEFMVNLRTTMLDDPTGLPPFIETWTSEKLPWVEVRAPHAYPGFPPMEDMERLLGAFAVWAG